jgi:glycosyltransferase involved in cell wall biosynthesis
VRIYSKKISKYSWFTALNSNPDLIVGSNMILNLDDPTFSATEINELLSWESKVKSKGFSSCIVCTTKRIADYLKNNEIQSNVIVIPQGHSVNLKRTNNLAKSSKYLDIVYISPSIDIAGDKHGGHTMWDASTLLVEIWPLIQSDNLRLHLIGKLGKNASSILSDKRIIPYGLLSVSDCADLLPSFDLALYPRKIDNGWLPQKLVEYIGAGLPILGFRLIDTEIIEELGVGVLVDGVDEFASRLDHFCENKQELETLRKNSRHYATQYSWKSLADNFEAIYTVGF